MEVDLVHDWLHAGTGLGGSHPDISDWQSFYLNIDFEEIKAGVVDIKYSQGAGGD